MSLVLASIGQFWKRAMGLVIGRWHRNPPCFLVDLYTVLRVATSSLKRIPISNKLRLVFSVKRIAEKLGFQVDYINPWLTIKGEAARVHPHIPETRYLRRLLVKLVRALNHGLRLQSDSRVTVCYVDENKQLTGRCEHVVAPLYGKEESKGCVDTLGKLWDMKCDIEHLEGLNWDLTVVKSEEPNFYYAGHGKIVIHTEIVNCLTEDELVAFLAHEVGHGVAMHPEGHPLLALFALIGLIPCTSGFWFCAIFVRLFDFMLYSCRRMELEAHYIGLLLMASAGYDPKLVLHLLQKFHHANDKHFLDTTHPSAGRIVDMLSQDTVMDRALKIYEQVQAGLKIPSFIEQSKIVPFNPIFSPLSIKQLFFPDVDGSPKLSR